VRETNDEVLREYFGRARARNHIVSFSVNSRCPAPRGCVTSPEGELEPIQFLLGHVPVQTTERYLGCKQKLRNAVNDGIALTEA
jgi:hypothetical protein